jgi:hypothetical protein
MRHNARPRITPHTKKGVQTVSQTIVTYTVKPGREDENTALVRAVFDELAETKPLGFRYAVFQRAESGEFLHLYTDEGAASGGTLQQLPTFATFVSDAADRHEKPAVVTSFEMVGAYRIFNDLDDRAKE